MYQRLSSFEKDKGNSIFLIGSTITLMVSLFYTIFTRGFNLNNSVWALDTGGIFPDFFETLWASYRLEPYKVGSIYPAFTYLIGYVLDRFLPYWYFMTTSITKWTNLSMYPISFLLGISVFSGAAIVLIYLIRNKIGTSIKHTKLLYVVLATSAPFIYGFERGNLVFYSVIFSLLFILNHDDESIKKRRLSYVFLSIAIVMKIYPVLLVLMIPFSNSRREKWRELLRFILILLPFAIIPFLFTGGLSSIMDMVTNISKQVGKAAAYGPAYKINISNTIQMIASLLGFDVDHSMLVARISRFMPYLWVALALIAFKFSEIKWKKVALLILIIILFPKFSWIYNGLYLFIPLTLFLITKGKNSKMDILYGILFIGAIGLFAYGDLTFYVQSETRTAYATETAIASISQLLLCTILSIESIYIYRKKRKINPNRQAEILID